MKRATLSTLSSLALLVVGACSAPPVVPVAPVTAPAVEPAKPPSPASRCAEIPDEKALAASFCPCDREAAMTAECERGSGKDCRVLSECAGAPTCGRATDLPAYLRFAKRGCELGDVGACSNLGDAYRRGAAGAAPPELADAAFARALASQRPACESGDARACAMVAQAYRKGYGVAVDAREARRMSEKSCALGNIVSCGVMIADDHEAGQYERAVEPSAKVCELHCLCAPFLDARRRGSPAATSALAAWKARCAQGDAIACDTATRVETTPAGLFPRAHFTGNAAVDTATLDAIIGIDKPDGPVAAGLSADETIARDALLLQAAYYDRGFLDVQLATPVVLPAPDGAALDVTFGVKEGVRYRIGKLTVVERDARGRDIKALGGRDLRRSVALKQGDWFARDVLVRDLGALHTVYGDAGYALVEARPETKLDHARGIIDIAIALHRGPLVHVERVAVVGNDRISTASILKDVGITEGQLYNETRIVEAKHRLEASGAFRRVDVSTAQGSNDARLKVTFELEEKPR